MKIIKAIIALVVVAAVGVGVFMFLSSPEQQIKGTWESEYLTLDFDKEGNVKVTYLDTEKLGIDLPIKGKGSFDGTYTVEEGMDENFLIIKATVKAVLEVSLDLTFGLEFEDGNMILTPISNGNAGEEIIFEKAE